MAEAAVEDRPYTRFYCHKCSLVFDSTESDYTCPVCEGGFIEEYVESSNPESRDSRNGENPDDAGFRGFPQSQRLSSVLGEIREMTDLLTFVGGQVDSATPERPGRPVRPLPRLVDPRRRRVLRSATIRPSMENLITDVVLNLTGQGILGGPTGNQMFIVGNPADYAWGREGLDTIVTQLLNQMDGTGPPPMPKEKIVEIPTIPVTEEQVSQKLQCSVCWEDFQLGEPVRSLPCLHVYHEACICPWLELHATCPICRKSLTEEAAEAANNGTNTVSNGLAALFRQQQQFDGTHDNLGDQIPISTSSNTSQPQSTQQDPGSIRNPLSNDSAGPSNSGSTGPGWQTSRVANNANRPTRVLNDQYDELRDPYEGGLYSDVELVDMDIDLDFD